MLSFPATASRWKPKKCMVVGSHPPVLRCCLYLGKRSRKWCAPSCWLQILLPLQKEIRQTWKKKKKKTWSLQRGKSWGGVRGDRLPHRKAGGRSSKVSCSRKGLAAVQSLPEPDPPRWRPSRINSVLLFCLPWIKKALLPPCLCPQPHVTHCR